jgi:tight adherence protein B
MSYFTIGEFWKAAILSAVLVAVVLLVMAGYQFFIEPRRKRRKINQRLSEGEHFRRIQILKEQSHRQTGGALGLLTKVLGTTRLANLQMRMLQADIYRHAGSFLSWVGLAALVGFGIGFLALKSIILGLVVGAALGTVPFLYLRWKRINKTSQFEKQMPDAMELLARSLRAGHTLPSAIELLGEEMGDPMATEMKIAYEEQKYGISVADSLAHMLERVHSLDLSYFVSAVLIQQETGGNLAELMETIAHVVRGRLNFKAKVRGLTAMGRLSNAIMIATPVVVFFILLAVAPQYEKALLETSTGRTLLLAGVLLAGFGYYSLRKIIDAVETA